MKKLWFCFLFFPLLAYAQVDTIRVSDLDRNLRGESQIAELLLDSEYRPINFFYSNVFEFQRKPFSGIARETRSDGRSIDILITEGRIVTLVEYFSDSTTLRYRFERIDKDTVLAKSYFRTSPYITLYWLEITTLFHEQEQLRFELRHNNGSISNGYFAGCKSGDGCCDDNTQWRGTLDGYQLDLRGGWRTEEQRKDGVLVHSTTFLEGKLYVTRGIYNHDTDYYLMETYWPNGKMKERGITSDFGWYGKWEYFDTSGHQYKSEWYSPLLGNVEELHLDSTYWYSLEGIVVRSEAELVQLQYCRFDKDQAKEQFEKRVTEKRAYYPDGAIQRKQIYDRMECPVGNDSAKAYVIEWYPTGKLWKYSNYKGESYEYYQNGNLKTRGSDVRWGPRDGVHMVVDTTGYIVVDRTYDEGKLIQARDAAYGKTDSVRIELAERLKGAAVLSLYPGNSVTVGTDSKLPYSHNPMPSWRDSTFIESKIVDSIAYNWAGVCLSLPDSLKYLRGRILNLSYDLNPAEGVWYYTLVHEIRDSAAFYDSCQSGILKTRNQLCDQYFDGLGYKIVTWTFHKDYMFGNDYGSVVIQMQQPLNFLEIFHATYGGSRPVTVFCGKSVEQKPSVSLGITRMNRSDNFIRMFLTLSDEGPKKNYTGYMFIANSDSSVDLKRASIWQAGGGWSGRYYDNW